MKKTYKRLIISIAVGLFLVGCECEKTPNKTTRPPRFEIQNIAQGIAVIKDSETNQEYLYSVDWIVKLENSEINVEK